MTDTADKETVRLQHATMMTTNRKGADDKTSLQMKLEDEVVDRGRQFKNASNTTPAAPLGALRKQLGILHDRCSTEPKKEYVQVHTCWACGGATACRM